MPSTVAVVLILLGLSTAHLVRYGLNYNEWVQYGISFYRRDNPRQSLDPAAHFVASKNRLVQGVVYQLSAPIWDSPRTFTIVSTGLRFLVLLALYRVCRAARLKRWMALATTILFSLGMGLRGTGNQGLYGPLIWNDAGLSTALCLGALALLLEGCPKSGGFAFGCAAHIHPLYTLGAFSASLCGFACNEVLTRRRVTDTIQTAAIFLLLAAPLSGGIDARGIPPDQMTAVGRHEWFTFLILTNPSVVTYAWALPAFAHRFALVALFAWLLRPPESGRALLRMLVGTCLWLVVFFGLEILHLKGVYLPRVSDILIAAELRRGVWIMGLLATLALAHSVQRVLDQDTPPPYITVLTFGLIATVLTPLHPVLELAALAALGLFVLARGGPRRLIMAAGVLAIVILAKAGGLCACWAFGGCYSNDFQFDPFYADFKRFWSPQRIGEAGAYLLVVCAIANLLQRGWSQRNRRFALTFLLAFAPALTGALALHRTVARNLVHIRVLLQDLSPFPLGELHDVARKPHHQMLGYYLSSTGAEPKVSDLYRVMLQLEDLEPAGRVLYSPGLASHVPQCVYVPRIFDENIDYSTCQFSLAYFRFLDYRLNRIFKRGALNIYGDGSNYQDLHYVQWASLFREIHPQEFQQLSREFGIRYLVTDRELPFNVRLTSGPIKVYELKE